VKACVSIAQLKKSVTQYELHADRQLIIITWTGQLVDQTIHGLATRQNMRQKFLHK